jgi:YD repeat-containing protein
MRIRRQTHRVDSGKAIFAAFLLLVASTAFGAETISYEYDDLGRLTRATYGNGTVVTYTYDDLGNRLTKQTAPGTGAAPSSAGSQSSERTLPGLR